MAAQEERPPDDPSPEPDRVVSFIGGKAGQRRGNGSIERLSSFSQRINEIANEVDKKRLDLDDQYDSNALGVFENWFLDFYGEFSKYLHYRNHDYYCIMQDFKDIKDDISRVINQISQLAEKFSAYRKRPSNYSKTKVWILMNDLCIALKNVIDLSDELQSKLIT